MSKLQWGRDSFVYLVGVKQRTMVHASYVYDFLDAMKVDSIFIQQAPDVPVFIKSKRDVSYLARWHNFLRSGQDSRFFVSSSPTYTSDLLLNNKKIKALME